MPEPDAPTGTTFPAGTTWGPTVRPANRSIDAAGSIHDDATAEGYGFRGGTVAGSIHLDHYGPLLRERYGREWFERGVLSMYFRTPTTHLEPVRIAIGPDEQAADERGADGSIAPTWIVAETGALVGEGEVGIPGADHTTVLDRRDRRPVPDPSTLDLLARLPTGVELDAGETALDLDRQRQLCASAQMMTGPLDWYTGPSPWGPPVACPSMMVHTLWAPFERRLRGLTERAVGLYGAIELRHLAGPVRAERTYRVRGVVETLSSSPRTEIFWARTTVSDAQGPVATLLMMIRLLRPTG